jgi:hypothetical protein
MAIPRIALLADTDREVNGAARTCREWLGYARRQMESLSWDGVFAEVYRGYASWLASA